ncbi:MAG: UDP-N-acetylglucosamine 2-epimerase (hydrolyzing) [Archangiaceae bacterium]|nr:UDP-N-acetylglucosamine 2-epimerase (hydrolyzing) [Archangiaceae bacterium]
MNARRKVCVVLVDRANYGRLKPVMVAIRERPELQLQVIAAGTMVLERFDQPVKVVQADGFTVDGQIYTELEGSTPATMAKSVGFGVMEFASEFQRLKPDVVLIIGDRYEALSAALAAAYMNLCIVHLQGGEVSGSIDESARHCISKLSQFHFPATKRSADYLVRMGEREDTILGVGCPSSDIARRLDSAFDPAIVNDRGNGIHIDVEKPFLLVVFHPVTTEYGGERQQTDELIAAIHEQRVPTAWLWPNIDAGSDHISKALRRYRSTVPGALIRTLTNLSPEAYLRVLKRCACAIGNSSSFVRDAGFLGTPVVLVGARQDGRERDTHVVRVNPTRVEISRAISAHLEHGRYAPSTLYGDGEVSSRIAKALVDLKPYVQKRLAFGAGVGS